MSKDGIWKEVPAISERPLIIKREHDMRGHPGFISLYNTLKRQYFWVNMARDIAAFLKLCLGCVGEKA